MRKFLFTPFLILILIFTGCENRHTPTKYDEATGQQPIMTIAGIDSVLAEFETVQFSQLTSDYLAYSHSDQTPYKAVLQTKTYVVIRGDAVFKFIVGKNRIQQFLT